jgi:hypothetical protein
MTQDLLPAIHAEENVLLSKKAWTAYVSLTIYALIFLIVGILMIVLGTDGTPLRTIGIIEIVVVLLIAGYKWLKLRTITLYYNSMGVWEFSGLFPWNRGVRGVKWRDLEQATFDTGFFAWALRSNTIRLGHRFTRTNEVVVSHMSHAREAVVTVNDALAELARKNMLG